MFNITLYNFKKNENSTARPSSDGTVLPCRMLSDSSIIKPAVEISRDVNCTDYNYAYIPEFNRYFWIRDVKFQETKWVLFLECDVLATYKTEIGNTSLYILRASAEFDGTITDGFYPAKASPILAQETKLAQAYPFYSGGVVVLNCAGQKTTGATTLIQFMPDVFRQLVSALYLSIDGWQVSDIVSEVVKKFGGNPVDLINSAMWFPYPFEIAEYEPNVWIGSWESNLAGGYITDTGMTIADIDFTLPKHPQRARGTYLDVAPFTRYQLYIPSAGIIQLEATALKNEAGIKIRRQMDALSGDMIIRIYGSTTNNLVASLTTRIGIPINISGQDRGASAFVESAKLIGSVAGTMFTGNPLFLAGAIPSAETSLTGTPTHSSMGSGTIMGDSFRLDTLFLQIPSEDNARNGRPLCAIRTPASLGGFMMVQRGDVEIDGTFEEMLAIKNFLERGFYYE